MDPDLPIAHDLRTWYLEEGMNVEMTDVSIRSNNHEKSNSFLTSLGFILYN